MKSFLFWRKNRTALYLTLGGFLAACSSDLAPRGSRVEPLSFGPEVVLGSLQANPAAPFLRFAPDGRLFAVWTEDAGGHEPKLSSSTAHHHQSGKMAPSLLRDVLLAASSDGGKTWSPPKRINDSVEAIEGEEGGPRLAFGLDDKAYAVWSIPNAKGDKTRANIRFAMENGKGGFTAARTLNEVRDTARFPIIEFSPDGNLLVAWIDRRVDNPTPRSLYLMRIGPAGEKLTSSYKVGDGLCECCRLGIAFADGGKTIYIVDRQVSKEQIRNHALRKSTDGGKSFNAPVEISDDGWRVASCPHSGPSIGRDGRGYLHVTWFTLGRSPDEAGVYYSISKDGGQSFSPRRLVQADTAAEILHPTLGVARDGTVYFAWENVDETDKAQVFVRTLAPDGNTWSPIQQISQANGNASRPVLALSKNQLYVAWTETDGETSRAVLRSASISQ